MHQSLASMKVSLADLHNALFLVTAFLLVLLLIVVERTGLPDVENYILNYTDTLYGQLPQGMEKSFEYLARIASHLGGVQTLFVFYSVLAAAIKLALIFRRSQLVFLSLAVYLSFYFTLQDLIQIRVAVSCSFFLLFVFALLDDRRLSAVLWFLISVVVHLQAIFIIPYWIYIKTVQSRVAIIFSLVLSFIVGRFVVLNSARLVAEHFSERLPSKVIANLEFLYQRHEAVSFLNHHVLGNLAIIAFYLFVVGLHKINKEEFLFLKTVSFALCFLFLFQTINVVAWRAFEFFNIAIIFILPYIILSFRQRTLPMFFAVLYIVANLYGSLLLWNVF